MSISTAAVRPGQSVVARFMGVGTINTAIDFGLYVLLCLIGVPALLANLVSTSSGLSFSYWANRRFTFRVRGVRTFREVLLFLLGTGVGLWLLQPVLIELVTAALAALHPSAVLEFAVPKGLAIIVGVGWNYWFYSRVVFRSSVRPVGYSRQDAGSPVSRED